MQACRQVGWRLHPIPTLSHCPHPLTQRRHHLRVRRELRLVARVQRVQPHHRQELHPPPLTPGWGGQEPQPPTAAMTPCPRCAAGRCGRLVLSCCHARRCRQALRPPRWMACPRAFTPPPPTPLLPARFAAARPFPSTPLLLPPRTHIATRPPPSAPLTGTATHTRARKLASGSAGGALHVGARTARVQGVSSRLGAEQQEEEQEQQQYQKQRGRESSVG